MIWKKEHHESTIGVSLCEEPQAITGESRERSSTKRPSDFQHAGCLGALHNQRRHDRGSVERPAIAK
jgi:hypothetical protein